jgi:NADH-quinone oxidoreductase subunit G
MSWRKIRFLKPNGNICNPEQLNRMPTLYIDNQPYEVSPGKNLLETCLTLGFDLPYFCWHPALGSVGACRQCAIKVYRDKDDKKGKLVMSCMEPVTNDQHISINDSEAHSFRENIIGWLMTNHPHDCAICDEGGSCHLQDMTVMTGHAYRKFRYHKRTYKNQYLGPFINHEMNRCIQCYRCVRFYKDYAGGHDLDAFASRNQVYFGRSEDGVLENEFSGNLSEVCPTGVFTDKTLKQHYTRKWDLTMAPSVCQHCSLGCNTIAGERYGTLRMVANRYNGQVNGYFLCDRGRFGYEFVNAPTRIQHPQVVNGADETLTIDKFLSKIETLKGSKLIGIGSGRASLESNFMLRKIVGDNNYYQGVSEQECYLANLIVRILSIGPVPAFSLKEVEKADTVLVLGEDLTNTAPMLALAVRQAARRQPARKAQAAKIPEWNDAAMREIAQHESGPVFLGTVTSTKLDEIATATFKASPGDLARLGFAIAGFIRDEASEAGELSDDERDHARKIANALLEAECPVVISGTSLGTSAILEASANIANALHQRNNRTGIVLTLPECNSMGLSLFGGMPFDRIREQMTEGAIDSVIILENDLYRHADRVWVDDFLSQHKNIIVLDHTRQQTAGKASMLIPAGTFAEADGTLINNEGRAQRFFQVYEPSNGVQESWRWLLHIAKALDISECQTWHDHDDVIDALANEVPVFKAVRELTPPAAFRVNGQKIPRQPHRYSGRTAMNAAINVSEPKPPEDHDSSLSYTMEGTRTLAPSSMIPFFWSPGWNSVQSVGKYQEEMGGALRGGDPGIRLLSPGSGNQPDYFSEVPHAFHASDEQVLVVPIHHIFGSEEMSALAPAVAERVPKPRIVIGEKVAATLDKATLMHSESAEVVLRINEHKFRLPFIIDPSMPEGVVGLPVGLPGVTYCELPASGTFETQIPNHRNT